MASVAAPGSITTTPQTQLGQQPAQVPHGTKRAADGSLEHEQRLSKRFDLLNLVDNNGTRLYIPVPGSTDATLPRPPSSPIASPHPLASVIPLSKRQPKSRPPRSQTSEDMQIEDTPHRVYIHDLAAELSDIESDEENPIFLADIEKHLSKIPRHVLQGPEPKATEYNQLVLYQDPSSLSVPEERDSVRKAIAEARRRIREKQAHGDVGVGGSGGSNMSPVEDDVDVDAMDID
ncbi:hypothetical protein CC86DRAFT_463174 [Ophiobolus disseminans]|uniref:Uncharacterized protein n=1 Tax=Ophiobolus disseminans TaxID=1469910 RepID=A0A6A7AEC5_9PLEO|nr:hypothetical protein CC86DRAFT_463174 [Ophiobolus disseminans]